MKREEMDRRLADVYCGILHGSRGFREGEIIKFQYLFEGAEYQTLKEKYPLEQIAGKGGDFERTRRLCRHFAPKLAHKSDYIGEVNDSLKILSYSYGKPEYGVNCVAKAKILADCCLALGIYARRLWLIPNSPYDGDCHVVTEIYDRKRENWLLLDPTTGGWFTDGKEPLGALEVREKFALRLPVSVVLARQKTADIATLSERNLAFNVYYMKNFFLLAPETVSGYGKEGDCAFLEPVGFDRRSQKRQNLAYGRTVTEGELSEQINSMLANFDGYRPRRGTLSMWDKPYETLL